MSIPGHHRGAVIGSGPPGAHGVVAHENGHPPPARDRHAHAERRAPAFPCSERTAPNSVPAHRRLTGAGVEGSGAIRSPRRYGRGIASPAGRAHPHRQPGVSPDKLVDVHGVGHEPPLRVTHLVDMSRQANAAEQGAAKRPAPRGRISPAGFARPPRRGRGWEPRHAVAATPASRQPAAPRQLLRPRDRRPRRDGYWGSASGPAALARAGCGDLAQ